jgi:hypothetical protein
MFNVVSNVSICSVCLRIAKLCWVFGICMILYVFVLTFLVLILIHTWLWDHLLWRSALSYFGNIRYATRFHAGNSRSIVMSLLNLTDLGHLKSGSTDWSDTLLTRSSFWNFTRTQLSCKVSAMASLLIQWPKWDPIGIQWYQIYKRDVCLPLVIFKSRLESGNMGVLKGMNLNTSRSKLKTHFQVSESRFGHCRMKIRSQTSDL